jgi:hypothetical protein
LAALDGGALTLPLKGREIAILLPLKGGKSLSSSPFKGEAWRGMGLQILGYQPNLLLYRFYLLKNFIVPESENAKTSRL